MISRGPRTQCQMLECLESHSFSAALSPAPPFGGGGRGGGRKQVGGAHWRGPGMAGGGRRKECGSGYPDRLVFQEKPRTGVWGWQPLTI